jgi:mycoredoxin
MNLRLSLLFTRLLFTRLHYTRLHYTRLHYTKRNTWWDKDAAAFVRSVADGNETVPTVTVAGHAMVNPPKRQLLDAVCMYAPHMPAS